MINVINEVQISNESFLQPQIVVPSSFRIAWVYSGPVCRFNYLITPSIEPMAIEPLNLSLEWSQSEEKVESPSSSPADEGFEPVRFASAAAARSRVIAAYKRQQEHLLQQQFSPNSLRLSQSLDHLHSVERNYAVIKGNDEERPRTVAVRLPPIIALAKEGDSLTD